MTMEMLACTIAGVLFGGIIGLVLACDFVAGKLLHVLSKHEIYETIAAGEISAGEWAVLLRYRDGTIRAHCMTITMEPPKTFKVMADGRFSAYTRPEKLSPA